MVCETHHVDCAGCLGTVCVDHAQECVSCEDLFGESHIDGCSVCGTQLCQSHRETCTTCGESLCAEHAVACQQGGELHCADHLRPCSICTDDATTQGEFCEHHRTACVVDDEILCADHTNRSPISGEPICVDHMVQCSLCEQLYAPDDLDTGTCRTCEQLADSENTPPDEIGGAFRTARLAANDTYIIIYGSRLLKPNQLIVLDRTNSNTEIHRRNIRLIERVRRWLK